jgi:hypothetical protein
MYLTIRIGPASSRGMPSKAERWRVCCNTYLSLLAAFGGGGGRAAGENLYRARSDPTHTNCCRMSLERLVGTLKFLTTLVTLSLQLWK